jgi:hypothetical protein
MCPGNNPWHGTASHCVRGIRTPRGFTPVAPTVVSEARDVESSGLGCIIKLKRGAPFSVPLFDFDPQHRETAAIWRLVRKLPLNFGLTDGRMFRWWAINIPLNLLSSSRFSGDIDLMVCTLSTPRESPGIFYKTWEVKLMLVDASGKPRSLKSNKTERIVNQLKIHRKFGSPHVSLLELYLHEAGSKTLQNFPTQEVFFVAEKRAKALQKQLFGYQVLPFAHQKNEQSEDFGIFTLQNPFPQRTAAVTLLRAPRTEAKDGFLELAQHLSAFAESESKLLSKPLGFVVVTYCRVCRKLCLIHKRNEASCYRCFTPGWERIAGSGSGI